MEYAELAREIGSNIVYYRKRNNLTQIELAKTARVSCTTLSGIERTKAHPSISTLHRIADALDVPVWKLVEIRE